MEPKYIYFVRHGQTNANITRTCQGPDERLSPEGERQAYRLAERLKELSFQKVIRSDYERTRQTIEPLIGKTSAPVELSSLFREEIWPSAWHGRSEDEPEVASFISDLIERADDASWHVADAENTADIHNRVIKALESLEADSANEILVVTHGAFLKQIVGHILLSGKGTHKQVAQFKNTLRTTNTGITVAVHKNNQWKILTWNDHAHFAE